MPNREVSTPSPAFAPEAVDHLISTIRNHRVLLDEVLAPLYGVETKTLVRAMRRNLERFPLDFMFQLTKDEYEALRYQIGTSNSGRGGRRYMPYAYTEQGVAMLSTVLHSERAVAVNIEIMRAFVRLRSVLAEHAELAARLDDLEERFGNQFEIVFAALRNLTVPPDVAPKRIGFRP